MTLEIVDCFRVVLVKKTANSVPALDSWRIKIARIDGKMDSI